MCLMDLHLVMGHGSDIFTYTRVQTSCVRVHIHHLLIKPLSALYASIHPDPEAPAKVPILEDTDGTTLIESLTVARYLDAKYPERPLMPKSPADVAKVGRCVCVGEAMCELDDRQPWSTVGVHGPPVNELY